MSRGLYILIWKRKHKLSIRNKHFVCHRIVSAVKGGEFVNCDTDHYLVVAKVRETLSVSITQHSSMTSRAISRC
jgi:hypothetical protein